MLKNNVMFRFILFALCGGLLCFNTAVQAKTLKVCYDQWPPMTIFPTKDMPGRGAVMDMVANIYEAKGYKLEYYEVPYARGMEMVAAGQCDMLPEKEFSPLKGEGFVYAQEATFEYPTAFVIRRNDPWHYHGVSSLKGKRIGTGPGWNYSSMSNAYQEYLDAPENEPFVEVIAGVDDVVDRMMSMIAQGRIDLYADNYLVLQYVLNRHAQKENLQIVQPGLKLKLIEKPIFSTKIALSERKKLIEIWDKGRKAMKGAKEKAILKRYNIRISQ